MERIDRWIPNPAHEQEELRGVLGEMQRDAAAIRPLKRFPTAVSPSMWEGLRGMPGERVGLGGNPTDTQLLRLDGEGRFQARKARKACECTLQDRWVHGDSA